MHKDGNWEKAPKDMKHGYETWTHTGAHKVNDDERDGEIEFSDEVLKQFRDDEDDG